MLNHILWWYNCIIELLNFFIDTNECVFGTNNCSENAECMDTTGSFICTCKPGFKGDGFNCIGSVMFQQWFWIK